MHFIIHTQRKNDADLEDKQKSLVTVLFCKSFLAFQLGLVVIFYFQNMFLLEANKVGSSCGLAVECTDLMRLSFVAGKRKSSRGGAKHAILRYKSAQSEVFALIALFDGGSIMNPFISYRFTMVDSLIQYNVVYVQDLYRNKVAIIQSPS